MLQSIISQIIGTEFQKVFQGQHGETPRNKGMKVTFRLNPDFEREEGYRNLELLIFGGGSNYISVFARMDWTVVPVEGLADEDGLKPGFDYTRGSTPWVHFSCHDSCWTSDGVESVIRLIKNRVSILGARYGHWYETVEISDEELEAFRRITNDTRGGKATHASDFASLEFRFPAVAQTK